MFRLTKLGFGNFKEVTELDSRVVIQALHYEDFISDYEYAYMEIEK